MNNSRTLIDLFLAITLVVLCVAIILPVFGAVHKQERLAVVCVAAKELHGALGRYHDKNRAFPGPTGTAHPERLFATLEHLGYLSPEIARFLLRERIDAYETPHDRGNGHEYWIEITLVRDPAIRLLVARSDAAPLSKGTWVDGALLYRDGKIEPL